MNSKNSSSKYSENNDNLNYSKNYGVLEGENLTINEKIKSLKSLDLSELIQIISQLSTNKEQEDNFFLYCLFFRDKINECPNILSEILILFSLSSAEEQININDTLCSILTYSSHRHFSENFINSFSSPSIESIKIFFEKLQTSSKNQFILYSLNSTLTSFVDISTSE